MRTLAEFVRIHHWAVLLFIVGVPIICGLITGWNAVLTQVGWSVAVGWVISALIEATALAADRWRPDDRVSRPTLVASLIIIAVIFSFRIADLLATVVGFSWWSPTDSAPVYLTILPPEFGLAALTGVYMVVQWAGLLAAVLMVRSFWASRRSGVSGMLAPIAMVVVTILWASIAVTAMESARYFIHYYLDGDIFSIEWRFHYLGPTLLSLWALGIALTLWSVRPWLGRATGTETGYIIFISIGVCLLPFAMRLLSSDRPMFYPKSMQHWYILAILIFPVVMWTVSMLLLRTRRTADTAAR